MTRRAPKSIRLTEIEESLSAKLAEKSGNSWHSWTVGLIRNAIKRDKDTGKVYREATDQEKCS